MSLTLAGVRISPHDASWPSRCMFKRLSQHLLPAQQTHEHNSINSDSRKPLIIWESLQTVYQVDMIPERQQSRATAKERDKIYRHQQRKVSRLRCWCDSLGSSGEASTGTDRGFSKLEAKRNGTDQPSWSSPLCILRIAHARC